MKRSQLSGTLSMLFVMIIWGSSFTVTKIILEQVPPLFFSFIRFFVASMVLLPVMLFSRSRPALRSLTRRDYGYLVLMGITGVTLFYLCFNLSLLYTTAATGALIQGFIPVSIALFSFIFLREKLTRYQAGGILLSVIGVLLIGFTALHAKGSEDSLKGNLLMIGSVICWSFYTIISKKMGHIPVIVVTCLSSIAGTALLLPPALLETGLPFDLTLSASDWLIIGYLGAVASALCYLLYNKALETLPPAQVGIYLNLDPIIGAAMAVFFLKESLSLLQLVGGILVLTGIFISMVPVRKKQPGSPKTTGSSTG